MDFQKIIQRALEIREKYAEFERRKYGEEWTKEQIAQGFSRDVTDLISLVSSNKGGDFDKKLAHELSDCLWSVLVLADKYSVDIEKAFLKTMDEIEEKITPE